MACRGRSGAGGQAPAAGLYSPRRVISQTATIPLVLVAQPKVPAKTVKDFIAWGKAKDGGLHALAITSEKRSPLLPDVPTIREATGKTTMDMGAWQGLLVTKGVPADVVAKPSTALKKTLADASLRERLTSQGSVMLGGWQKDYVDYMKAEGERWTRVIKDTGAKVD